MSADAEAHSNVYRLVAALGAMRVTVIPGEADPLTMDRDEFTRFAARRSVTALLSRWDVPGFLLLLLVAGTIRRPAMPGAAGRRRRVLHIISTWGVGGAQVQLAEVLNRTPSDEFEVDLLVLGRSDGEFSRQWLRRDDVTVSFVDEWPKLVFSVRAIADRCREGRYDIVHTWLFMANMVGAAAARLAGVPLVIASVRNLSVWKREAWYRKWWHRIGDALGSRAADVVTVNARALVQDHADWAWMSPRNIEVIHNGLDPARLAFDRAEARTLLQESTGASASALFVGTVGRLAHEKDQATFLRVLANVRRVRRDVHGVVVGNGELRGALERLAQELGLEGAVTFLGERSDARRLAAGFDLFVLSSRSEGFPNVLLEATFMGVPCVATDIAGNPDVLERPESLFPAGDVQRGAERVLAALDDMERTRRRTGEVRERALALFTAERSVKAWLDLYRRWIAVRSGQGEAAPASAVLEAQGIR
jgi:glycosyltransferase involved in cell wall biosynthesis